MRLYHSRTWQGQSEDTIQKEKDLKNFLDAFLRVVSCILENNKWNPRVPQTMFYCDATAGSGYNEKINYPGSPIMYLEEDGVHTTFNRDVHFIELNPSTYFELINNISIHKNIPGCRTIYTHNGSFVHIIPKLLDKLKAKPYGLIYFDLNRPTFVDKSILEKNTIFDMVEKICEHKNMRYIDVLISISATFYKRKSDWPTIEERLCKINKDRWMSRRAVGNQQWTLLYGTNWDSKEPVKEWEDIKLYDINDPRSDFKKLTMTVDEFAKYTKMEGIKCL